MLLEGRSYQQLVSAPEHEQTGCDARDSRRSRQQLSRAQTRGRADIVGVRMPQGQGPFLTEGQMIVIRVD